MTTTVDFDASQATQGPKVSLLSGPVGSGLTSDAFRDFSGFSSVYFKVNARLVDGHAGVASLTVTIEDSDDGNSWTTAETFTFGNDGVQGATVSSPKEFVRAVCSPTAGVWQLWECVAAPTYLDAAGGGSQPLEQIILPVAFDTPGLVIPASGPVGIKVCDLNPGDIIPGVTGNGNFDLGVFSITTAWDGSTPFLHLVGGEANRGDLPGTPPTPWAGAAWPFDLTNTDVDLFSDGTLVSAPFIFPALDDSFVICRVATSLYIYVDDGSGGDPGSLQGEGEIRMFVVRAP